MPYKVNIMESERGWGTKVDETKYFDSQFEAEDFVERFNARNNKDIVPDWYMYATTPEWCAEKE